MLYLPTCVGFGTGAFPLPRGFSRRHGISDSPARSQLTSPLGLRGPRIFLGPALQGCPWTTSATVRLPFPVPPSVIARKTRYRNINLLSIAYACRPRLRSRLTLRRLALLRKPWAFGGGVCSPLSRYSCQHSHFSGLHGWLAAAASRAEERSPTAPQSGAHSFGGWLEPRYIIRARTLDQ